LFGGRRGRREGGASQADHRKGRGKRGQLEISSGTVILSVICHLPLVCVVLCSPLLSFWVGEIHSPDKASKKRIGEESSSRLISH